MEFVFLSELFYDEHKDCKQILSKDFRPYIKVCLDEYKSDFYIPLRSHITHKEHVLWTDKKNGCGVDFSKAVIISDKKYINSEIIPHIRKDEFELLRGKEYRIKTKMLKYISEYNEALNDLTNARNKTLCELSTMQYYKNIIQKPLVGVGLSVE